jgi:phosphoribosylanthranilate isomerase
MAHMETSLMEQLEQIGVCEWHRYVDDTFVLLEPDTNIDDVLHVPNEFQPSIKFTHEPEKDNTIAFLDVQVIRTLVKNKCEKIDQDEQQAQTFIFDTTIHRKETFAGLMTDWHSFVPISYKKSTVVSMIQRALSIC